MPKVMMLMGSDSDLEYMKPAIQEFRNASLDVEVHVASAHRTPDRVEELVTTAPSRGVEVIIAGAGGAAHLAGVVASHTVLPVIGVPLPTLGLGGTDALMSTVQMPRGIPVATVGIGNSANAALLAMEILAIKYDAVREYLMSYRARFKEKVMRKDEAVKEYLESWT